MSNNNEVTVKFIGNNASGVTGSMILVEYKGISLLVDAGLEQGKGSIKDFKQNSKLNSQLAPSQLKYTISTHLNIDHIGKIPFLYKKGFKGKNIMVSETRTIAKYLWRDSSSITAGVADLLNRYDKTDKHEPLYSSQDIEHTIENMIELDFYEDYHLGEDMYVHYIKAGHIFRAGTVVLEFRDSHRKLVVTGDRSSDKIPYHFVDKPDEIPNCNVLIAESTYCRPSNEVLTPELDREDLIKQIKKTILNGKSVILPSFSLQRSSEILKVIYDGLHDWEYKNYDVYLDSPLSANIHNHFRRYFEDIRKIDKWGRFSIVSSAHKSENICNSVNRPKVVVSSSGMGIDFTRSSHHIKSLLGLEGHLIIKIGYAPETVPLGKIFSEQSEVKIMDSVIQKRCNLIEYNSFSSHIDYNSILDTYSEIKASNGCYLVHGEQTYKDKLADKLNEVASDKCNSTKFISVNRNDIITF